MNKILFNLTCIFTLLLMQGCDFGVIKLKLIRPLANLIDTPVNDNESGPVPEAVLEIDPISNQLVKKGDAALPIDANFRGRDIDSDGETLSYTCFYDRIVNNIVTDELNCDTLSGLIFSTASGELSWDTVGINFGKYEFKIIAQSSTFFAQRIFNIEITELIDDHKDLDYLYDGILPSTSDPYYAVPNRVKVEYITLPVGKINVVDSLARVRTIDLGVEVDYIEIHDFKNNHLFFETNRGSTLKDYYINLNLENPTPVDLSTVSTCRAASYYSIYHIFGDYFYCINTSYRLQRISLNNFSDVTTYSNVNMTDNRYSKLAAFEVAGALYFVADYYPISIHRMENGLITKSWESTTVNFTELNQNNFKVVGDQIIAIGPSFDYYVLNSNSTVTSIDLPIDNYPEDFVFNDSTNLAIYGNYAYVFLCRSPGAGEDEMPPSMTAMYRIDISNPLNPSKIYVPVIGANCQQKTEVIFEHHGKIYFTTSIKNQKYVSLFELKETSGVLSFEKVIDLADIFSWDRKNKAEAYYKDEDYFCFSGLYNNRFYPHCINPLNQVVRFNSISRENYLDAAISFKKFNNKLYFLIRDEVVKAYKSNFDGSDLSVDSTINTNIDLEFAWGTRNDGNRGAFTTESTSDLIFASANSLIADVDLIYANGDKYSYIYKKLNNSEITSLKTYKNKVLLAHGHRNYYNLSILEEGKENKIITNYTIKNPTDFMSDQASDRFYYIQDIQNRLLRIDLESEVIQLVDENVTDMKAFPNNVFYRKIGDYSIFQSDFNLNSSFVHQVTGDEAWFWEYSDVWELVRNVGDNNFLILRYMSSDNIYHITSSGLTRLNIDDDAVFSGFVETGHPDYLVIPPVNSNYAYVYHIPTKSIVNTYSTSIVNNYTKHFYNNVDVESGNYSKILIGKSGTNLRFLEFNSAGHSVVNYPYPTNRNSTSDTFNVEEMLHLIDNNLYFSIKNYNSKSYVYKLNPGIAPNLVFERDLTTVIAGASASFNSASVTGSVNFFHLAGGFLQINIPTLIDGYLGVEYGEIGESNTYVKTHEVSLSNEHILGRAMINRTKLYNYNQGFAPAPYLYWYDFSDNNILIGNNIPYSLYEYYDSNTSAYRYKITDYKDFDNTTLEIDESR